MRPTQIDIAAAAGVSPATVDRVLHRRGKVSKRSQAKVLTAARALGYGPEAEAAQVPATYHLVVPAGANAYIAELARQARAHAAAHETIEILRPMALDPLALADALASIEGSDGVILIALDHTAVRQAMQGLVARGIPIVTLASDLPQAPRTAYVGVDNTQAGRLAADVMGRFAGAERQGTVVIFAGHLGYHGHKEREIGFRRVIAEAYPMLRVLDLRESREDRARARSETLRVLDRHPDLVGLYSAGGGTVGICAGLTEAGRQDIVFVAHELTEENRGYVQDGTLDAVIDQSARDEIQAALAILRASDGGRGEQPVVRPRLILRENLP